MRRIHRNGLLLRIRYNPGNQRLQYGAWAQKPTSVRQHALNSITPMRHTADTVVCCIADPGGQQSNFCVLTREEAHARLGWLNSGWIAHERKGEFDPFL